MNLPTTEEMENLFKNHWGSSDKSAVPDLKALYSLASQNEYIKGVAMGGMQTVLSGITAAGATYAPALSLILMGFRLGVLWRQDDAMTAYLKYLEENPEPKKEGE